MLLKQTLIKEDLKLWKHWHVGESTRADSRFLMFFPDKIIGEGAGKERKHHQICVFFYRSCRGWTTFTLNVKSSTQTSSQKTSLCVWKSSPTKHQQGAAAPPRYRLGRKPVHQARFILSFIATDAWECLRVSVIKRFSARYFYFWWAV